MVVSSVKNVIGRTVFAFFDFDSTNTACFERAALNLTLEALTLSLVALSSVFKLSIGAFG